MALNLFLRTAPDQTAGATGQTSLNIPWTVNQPVGQVEVITIANAVDTTITPPVGASLCIITPDARAVNSAPFGGVGVAGSTYAVKGAGADVGVKAWGNQPMVIPVTGAFIINLSLGTAGSPWNMTFIWL